jgi:hypothetical protein
MKQILITALTLLLVSMSSVLGIDCSPCDKVRQCAKNTLYTDGFNLRFHSGVSPIIWKNRGCISFLSTAPVSCSKNQTTACNTSCVTPFFIESFKCVNDCTKTAITSIQIPEFNKLFRTPWIIGATLGYAIDTHQEVLLEFNYTQASNRHDYFAAQVMNTTATPVLLHINLLKYKNTSAYVGYRYNFDRMRCFPRDFLGDMAWFLGAKIGLLHHFGVRGHIDSSFTNMVDSSKTPSFDIFKSGTAFSGMAEVGIDICFNCDWSLMIAAEIAAAHGPACHGVVIPVTELSSKSMSTAKIGTEILFPVIFGLRYKF